MHRKFIITLITDQEDITSKGDTSFSMETHMGENHKSFFFFIFNSLHRFIGYNLLEESTPKICKLTLVVGYNLVKAPTSKVCK